MTVGEKIYKLRIYSGLSQKEFADKVGTSQSAINYWENGKRQPRVAQLKKIAKLLNFPLYDLLDDSIELENVELEMKRARPVNSYEMTEPPKPFTGPMSQYNKDNSIYIDPNLQKLYDSYEDSYSFDNLGEKILLNDYRILNEIGQSEARKRIAELTEIPRYTKLDEPPAKPISQTLTTVIAAHNDHADEPGEYEKMLEDIKLLKRPPQD